MEIDKSTMIIYMECGYRRSSQILERGGERDISGKSSPKEVTFEMDLEGYIGTLKAETGEKRIQTEGIVCVCQRLRNMSEQLRS